MATVAIFISDLENGVKGIQVDVRSDEPMSEDTDTLTPAQGVALATTVFLGSLINSEDLELEAHEIEPDEEETPSLELVEDPEAEE